MPKETLTPAIKSVPSSGGVKQGNKTLTTPNQKSDNTSIYGEGAGSKDKIF